MTIDPLPLQRAAALATGHQQHRPGTLYVVATPIGNLADITLRAIHVLGLVDAVACEDTRVAAQLLNHLGLQRPLLALHAHNERDAAAAVLTRLARGESVAYVSDAGTPAVSDPGALLVALAAQAGHTVVPLPGPSAAMAALSAAGDAVGPAGTAAAGGFTFIGFLPAKGGERRDALAAALAEPRTLILFEAPHRIAELLSALAAAAPQRTVTLCRELTKQFETIATLPAASLPAWLAADRNRERGEFVLVLHALPTAAAAAADALPDAAVRTLTVLLRELPLKQAVALATELSGAPRNALYQHALALRAAQQALLPAPIAADELRAVPVDADELPPLPLAGEGWKEACGEGLRTATTLTCSARSGLQAGHAARAHGMRLETPATPPAVFREREREEGEGPPAGDPAAPRR